MLVTGKPSPTDSCSHVCLSVASGSTASGRVLLRKNFPMWIRLRRHRPTMVLNMIGDAEIQAVLQSHPLIKMNADASVDTRDEKLFRSDSQLLETQNNQLALLHSAEVLFRG
ncbi:hypothetical protein E1B28_008002 [Marasmius oreades]|uniref:Uncharacterized protein n=1 Tax=Marasmius oreades TaxID=181124 RepID=A0A9P7S3G0_9AGAR|nr:uncharacterized protein E1B28_008002 [Marasmius oreades]KAG7094402.1 hypothetical protein E1B28_008002 [Marasmius oreades]